MLRRTWQKAERRVGKPRPASGALWFAKGDVVTNDGSLAQVKATHKKSYSLKLAELQQIENQAAGEDREAIFVISFETSQGPIMYKIQRFWPNEISTSTT